MRDSYFSAEFKTNMEKRVCVGWGETAMVCNNVGVG